MRNYVIGLVVTIFLLGISVLYKQQNTILCHHFPIPDGLKKENIAAPFYLFLFFSESDCMSCVDGVIAILKALPAHFCVAGIVLGDELVDIKNKMKRIGLALPLFKYHSYKRYLPWHTPTLFGVSPSGKIIFVLPGIRGKNENAYLKHRLEVIYGQFASSFVKDNKF